MAGRGGTVLQGRGEKTGWVMQEAKWEAMGRGPDLANPEAAAAEGWALQGCERWEGLSYGVVLNRAHP